MFWNLFERIINAVKHSEQSQQPENPAEPVSDVSQPWTESSDQQSPDSQQTADTERPNQWQD